MLALKRMVLVLGAIFVVGLIIFASGGVRLHYMMAPMTLLMVLGLTAVLGLLTYDSERLGEELKRIFIRSSGGQRRSSRKVLAQLALYGLVSGIVLAIVQILVQMGVDAKGTGEPIMARISLREPFTSLLYGVLTAVGLWVLSAGDGPGVSEEKSRNRQINKRQMTIAFGMLLLTVGVLSSLIMGMSMDDKRLQDKEQAAGRDKADDFGYAGQEFSEPKTGISQMNGLNARPGHKLSQATDGEIRGEISAWRQRADGRSEIVSEGARGVGEVELRWEGLAEPSQNRTILRGADLVEPAVKQSY